ncbi:receptor-type tyrosine-protein phosphatase eta, partial [Oryzias melastigma]|uniref:receptor-type tyrosine-protein phosphatase eta n=1 Tax=Oryzias melastigma TaxID=30732 RepID=UPI00168D7D3A
MTADNQTNENSAFTSSYTKPDEVRELTVTEITTSSVPLSSTEPLGQSSSNTVEWSDGSTTLNPIVTNKSTTISNLTTGVLNNTSVTAMTADNQTNENSAFTSSYTKPDEVRELTVTEITTSSVPLSSTEPLGQSSSNTVEWSDGSTTLNPIVTNKSTTISNLTTGVLNNTSVTAMTADNQTNENSAFTSSYTKPDEVRELTVTEITTSSVPLSSTEPLGQSSSNTVEWSDGSTTLNPIVTNKSTTISNLTTGVLNNTSVTAMTADNQTNENSAFTSSYTKPDEVRELTVTEITTSSVPLSSTEPLGKSSSNTVEWSDGSTTLNPIVTNESTTISNLTTGVLNNTSVTAMTADNQTKENSAFTSSYT